MPLFFILSGFLSKEESGFTSYLIKNIKTLLVPYVLLNFLAAFVFFCFNILFRGSFDFDLFVRMIKPLLMGTLDTPAYPCWFLICLFNVKLLSFFIHKANPLPRIAIILSLAFVAFAANYYNEFIAPFDISSAFLALPFFSLGYYLRKYKYLDKISTNRMQLGIFIVTTVILFISICFQDRVDLYYCYLGQHPILYYPVAIVGSLMVISLSQLLSGYNSKFINIVSAGTIFIMAMHSAVLWVINVLSIYFQVNEQIGLGHDIVIAVITILILYYPIILVQKYAPILMGKYKKSPKTR